MAASNPDFLNKSHELEVWRFERQMKIAALTAEIAALEALPGHALANQPLEAERARLVLELREGSPVFLTRINLKAMTGRTRLGR